jgi:hypothetical protein
VTREFRLPDRTSLPTIFDRLAIDERDREEILAAWPSPESDRAAWLSLERAYRTLVTDMGGFEPLELPGPADSSPLGRYFFAFVYLAALADVRRFHTRRGISDDISWATLSDLGRNLKRDRLLLGDGGLRTSGWLTLHFRGSIYQLGRLQFNRRENTHVAHAADSFRDGDPAVGIHIPESGPLTPEACDDALSQVRPFFTRHFADTPRIGTCTSWLLDPQLAEYLAPDSNAMRFQRRFTLVATSQDGDADFLRFIFHRIAPLIDELPQRTTLERAIVAHLRAGKHWRNRTGWLVV